MAPARQGGADESAWTHRAAPQQKSRAIVENDNPGYHKVREGGVEPPRPHGHTDLNRARLPIPPLALRH